MKEYLQLLRFVLGGEGFWYDDHGLQNVGFSHQQPDFRADPGQSKLSSLVIYDLVGFILMVAGYAVCDASYPIGQKLIFLRETS